MKIFYLEDVLSIVKANENNHLNTPSESNTIGESALAEEYRIALDDAITLALSNDELDTLRDLISSEGCQKIFNY